MNEEDLNGDMVYIYLYSFSNSVKEKIRRINTSKTKSQYKKNKHYKSFDIVKNYEKKDIDIDRERYRERIR